MFTILWWNYFLEGLIKSSNYLEIWLFNGIWAIWDSIFSKKFKVKVQKCWKPTQKKYKNVFSKIENHFNSIIKKYKINKIRNDAGVWGDLFQSFKLHSSQNQNLIREPAIITTQTYKQFMRKYKKITKNKDLTGSQEAPYGYDSAWSIAAIFNRSIRVMRENGT